MKANKTIYVTEEESGTENQYWQLNEAMQDIPIEPGQRRKVYVYELKEVRTVDCVIKVVK